VHFTLHTGAGVDRVVYIIVAGTQRFIIYFYYSYDVMYVRGELIGWAPSAPTSTRSLPQPEQWWCATDASAEKVGTLAPWTRCCCCRRDTRSRSVVVCAAALAGTPNSNVRSRGCFDHQL
jgi:hypothetical protein